MTPPRRETIEPALATDADVAALAAACDMAWVRRHYSAERLESAEAKAGWVEPDQRALDS